MSQLVEYYESYSAPHEALGRAARRLSQGGALYLGAGVGIEKVKKGDAESYSITNGTAKAESFTGPLSAVIRAFTLAGSSTAPDSPGGAQAVADPAVAARVRELRDEEAEAEADIRRYTARIERKKRTAAAAPWSPLARVDDDAWEARRLDELKADLTRIRGERDRLLATGNVEEVEQARPGTNFTKIPPKNVAKLKGIIEHYKGMAHPFTACVRDQVKHGLSDDHAKRRCAVVKDLAMGTTKWRKGGKGKVSEQAEALLAGALARIEVVAESIGLAATVQLVEGFETSVSQVQQLAEGVSNDFGLLSMAGHPLGLAAFGLPVEEAEFSEGLHPRDLLGRFKQKVAGLAVGASAELPDGHRVVRAPGKRKFYVHGPGGATPTSTDSVSTAAERAMDMSARSNAANSVGGATRHAGLPAAISAADNDAGAHNRRVEAYNRQQADRKAADRKARAASPVEPRRWTRVQAGDTVRTTDGEAEVVAIRQRAPDSVTELVGTQRGTNPRKIVTLRVNGEEREFQVDARTKVNVVKRPQGGGVSGRKGAPVPRVPKQTSRRPQGRAPMRTHG